MECLHVWLLHVHTRITFSAHVCLHHTHMHVRSPPQHTNSTQSITTLLHVLKYKHMPNGQLLVHPTTARHAVLQLQHTTSALLCVYKCVVQCLKTCNRSQQSEATNVEPLSL